MARRKSRTRRVYVPRRSRSRSRSALPRGTKGLLYALLGIPIIGWLLAKAGIIPAEYFLPVTVGATGVVTYLVDGKSQGLELIGAGVGLGVLPYVLSATQPKTASANVWV